MQDISAGWSFLGNRKTLKIHDIYSGWGCCLGLPRPPKILEIQDDSIDHKLRTPPGKLCLGKDMFLVSQCSLTANGRRSRVQI
jgi:hypothetical protein